jgi:hypothetical protein
MVPFGAGQESNSLFPNISPIESERLPRLLTVVVDTEEDFDWQSPTPGTDHSTTHLRNLVMVESIFAAYELVPAYLLTYPVLEDDAVIRIIRHQLEKGRCAVGMQLHPWVTPPFDGETEGNPGSFLGNLHPAVEERKFVACTNKFVSRFGFAPRMFRAGRYGLSAHTPHLLEAHGFLIDTSVAPRTTWVSEGGPNYAEYDCDLFRFGCGRQLLEIPLCRSVIGWVGTRSASIYNHLLTSRSTRHYALSALARIHCVERITLSPEGNDVPAMRRLVETLIARGHRVLTLSFHSSSLSVGRNPYVHTKEELHDFLDRLSEILHYLVVARGFQATAMDGIPHLLEEATRDEVARGQRYS